VAAHSSVGGRLHLQVLLVHVQWISDDHEEINRDSSQLCLSLIRAFLGMEGLLARKEY
jgi:hypothetical protein